MQDHLQGLIAQALNALVDQSTLQKDSVGAIQIERTRDPSHGDFASNIALAMAKKAGLNPRQLADKIIAALPADKALDRCEIAGPGFINFFIKICQHLRHCQHLRTGCSVWNQLVGQQSARPNRVCLGQSYGPAACGARSRGRCR